MLWTILACICSEDMILPCVGLVGFGVLLLLLLLPIFLVTGIFLCFRLTFASRIAMLRVSDWLI